jgi:phage terminase large subunit-like protein
MNPILKQLLEENKIRQTLVLESFLLDMQEKWDDENYYYDVEEARKIFKYISLLKNDKGTSKRFTILKFQFEIISEILCVKVRETNLRKFREAHINIARKNSKSFLIGIILSYLFFCQKKIFGALFIITGNTTKQATELYNTFKTFVESNKALRKKCKILDSTKTIIRKDNKNKLIVLSNDGGGADSYAVYSCALDEIHEYASDEIYGKLKTGSGIWDDPLTFTITTSSSGEDPNNLEMQLYSMCKKIEEEDNQEKDETFYYKIYEAEPNCEVDDYEQWFKANPALGDFRKPDDIVNLAKRVKLMPLQENMFRRMFLNQHVATDHIKNAINMDLWDECVKDIKIDELKGCECWGGLDLSSQHDITAFVLIFFKEETQQYIVVPYLFTAQETLIEREEKDKNPYTTWVKQKFLISTKGKYVSFEDVLEKMHELDKEFDIQKIGFDRFGSPTIMNRLEDKWDLVPLGQGTGTMTGAIRDFENLLIDKKLIIANNDVLHFMAKNCIACYNENMDVKYSKKKSKFVIDGIIAMLMGLLLAIEEKGIGHYDAMAELEKTDW